MSLRVLKRFVVGMVAVFALLQSTYAPAQGITDLFMSPEREKKVGAEQHEKILNEFGGAYDHPELAAYVTSIGQFLALTSEASRTQFTFTVLNSPVVNAFALPGGYVYVTRGLVALADNEAELAGVLAHEIGHVAARHGAQRQGQSVLATLGLMVLGAATESSAAVNLGQMGAAALLSGYSREDEYEADTLGVRYMSRAGFSPKAMSSFLSKLQAHHALEAEIQGRSGGEGFGFFATHPRTSDRVARAIKNAGAVTVSQPIVAQDIYFKKIDGIIYGDDPAQGVVKGQRFVHPGLGFEFTVPPKFSLLNGRSSVIAQGPGGAGIKFDMERRASESRMTHYIRDAWAPKAPLSNLEAVRVNGMDAATAVVEGVQGGKADVRLLAIEFDAQSVFRFVFVIPHQAAKDLDDQYRHTAFSFKRLSRSEVADIRPLQLNVHEVGPGQTIQSLAERMAVSDRQEERFLVLNGLSRGAALRTGQQVKLVTD